MWPETVEIWDGTLQPHLGREVALHSNHEEQMTRCLISGPLGCQPPLLLCWGSWAGLGGEAVRMMLFSDVTSVDFPTSLYLFIFFASFLPSWEQFICLWLLLGGDRVLISCLIHPRPPVPWHLAVKPDWAWSQACLGRQGSQGSGQSLCDVRQWFCSTVNEKESCGRCSLFPW